MKPGDAKMVAMTNAVNRLLEWQQQYPNQRTWFVEQRTQRELRGLRLRLTDRYNSTEILIPLEELALANVDLLDLEVEKAIKTLSDGVQW